jgi:hypothetical protein
MKGEYIDMIDPEPPKASDYTLLDSVGVERGPDRGRTDFGYLPPKARCNL